MRFTKMHGTGNDYIYVNGFKETVEDPKVLSIHLSNRHKGVGADGLVLILPSERGDFSMRMFNADGSESEMCGNAARCVGKYVYEKGMTHKTRISLETPAGIKTLYLRPDEFNRVEQVTVDMGEPVFEARSIPALFPESPVVGRHISVGNGGGWEVTCLSMGNPHAVIFTGNTKLINLPATGPVIEHSHYFPNRTNVEFVEVLSGNLLRMRVWERGTGETMACGTGACAALVAAVLNGLAERKSTVLLNGGELEIVWRTDDNHVYLTGNAVEVFEGEINW